MRSLVSLVPKLLFVTFEVTLALFRLWLTSEVRQSISSTSYLSLIVATSVVFRNHASCMVLLRTELTLRSADLQDVLSNRSTCSLYSLNFR